MEIMTSGIQVGDGYLVILKLYAATSASIVPPSVPIKTRSLQKELLSKILQRHHRHPTYSIAPDTFCK